MSDTQPRQALLAEIDLFIEYVVRVDEQQQARDLVRRYRENEPALHTMRAFYSSLPDPHEEAIVRLVFLRQKETITLLGVETARHGYFYAASEESAVFLGECGCDDCDPEAVAFFACPDQQAFWEQYQDFSGCADYQPLPAVTTSKCPVCAVAVGEYHLFGCLVEVCPWCAGQFSRCGCRFEQLGVEDLEDEEMLAELERIVAEKGRIPYAREQGPSYLSDRPADEDDSELPGSSGAGKKG